MEAKLGNVGDDVVEGELRRYSEPFSTHGSPEMEADHRLSSSFELFSTNHPMARWKWSPRNLIPPVEIRPFERSK